MSDQDVRDICPDCGARISRGSTACDLCGSTFDDEDRFRQDEGADAPPTREDDPGGMAASGADRVYCNQCGWRNQLSARFCSRCGHPLEDLKAAAEVGPAGAAAAAGASGRSGNNDFRKMAMVMAAGAILLVGALYAITAISKKAFAPAPAMQPQTSAVEGRVATEERRSPAAEQAPPEVESQADALRESADALSGAARAAKLAEVVNLYLTRGLVQQAAEAQVAVATELASADAWADAGNLSYRAMQEAEGPAKIAYATEAIEAYSRSLELAPDNLDVRTDMATAYLATNNPMEGVRQIRTVLDQDADHVQANFNYGVMLSMIGRTDQSIAQFERVMSLVEPGTDTHRQAELALQELRGQ